LVVLAYYLGLRVNASISIGIRIRESNILEMVLAPVHMVISSRTIRCDALVGIGDSKNIKERALKITITNRPFFPKVLFHTLLKRQLSTHYKTTTSHLRDNYV